VQTTFSSLHWITETFGVQTNILSLSLTNPVDHQLNHHKQLGYFPIEELVHQLESTIQTIPITLHTFSFFLYHGTRKQSVFLYTLNGKRELFLLFFRERIEVAEFIQLKAAQLWRMFPWDASVLTPTRPILVIAATKALSNAASLLAQASTVGLDRGSV
jgi:hypothetical protein